MRIILIRHGDPDYENDTLTEKGWREAELLAERISKWQVTDFYCSPLGRAKDTASPSLKKLKREAEIHEWMREFSYYVTDPTTGRVGVPWDFMPSFWTKEPLFYDKDRWLEVPVFQSNPEIKPRYQEACSGLDLLLSRYGYTRNGSCYQTDPGKEVCNDTIVIFCHLGAALVMISHLLGIAAPLLWQNIFLAPTSVSVLATEERLPGEAYFRAQVIGDTMHLYNGKEPVSRAGYFTEPFLL